MIRPVLALGLVLALAVGVSSSQPPAPAARQADQPTAAADQGGAMASPDTLDYVKEIAKQGTLGLLVVAILWSYRRDFFRKLEDKDRAIEERKEEREQLVEVLDKSTAAITNSAVATARQTDATHRLARAVENIERRQSGLPPSASTPV